MKSHPRLVSNIWEGVVASDFTLHQVRQRCYHLGQALVKHKLTCLVAYDTRFMSSLFAQDIYQHLSLQGVTVSLVPNPVPLPAVQFALSKQRADCALVVSARNRPYWYNGLVLLVTRDLNLSLTPEADAPEPTVLHEQPGNRPFPSPTEGNASSQLFVADSTLDARKPYLEMLSNLVDVNLIRRSTLTVFADPMHGTASGYLPAVIGEGSQTKAIEINRETDPLFGKATPLPATTGLSRLRKLVRESDSHIGLAFSADGTVPGVVDKNGEQIDQLEVVLLLASYLTRQYRQKGIVIAPAPAAGSPLASAIASLGSWEQALGFKVELTNNATNRIADSLANENQNLLIGCTLEGEIILNSYSLYPDALAAGLLMIELVARNGGSLRNPLDELRSSLSQ